MKILVTGAAGFMGGHLVDSLIKKNTNDEIFGVDDLSGGYMDNVNNKIKFTKLDLRNRKKTEEYINKVKPDLIFHLAADATEGRSQFTPINCTERNYVAYLNVLVPAIRNGLKKMILTSSMSVYGSQKPPFNEKMERKPDDIYAISKSAMERATEILSKVHGFKYTIIRPHNVYGPRQNMADPYRNVIAIFVNCLRNNKNYFIYGNGEQKRAFTYIDDFTPYILEAAFNKKADSEIFNIGPTKEYTINELSDVILKILTEYNSLGVEIFGNSDNMGSYQYNEKLSFTRAQVVANYFISKGIDRNRMKLTARAYLNPVASNKSEEGRARNRRVDFKFIKNFPVNTSNQTDNEHK